LVVLVCAAKLSRNPSSELPNSTWFLGLHFLFFLCVSYPCSDAYWAPPFNKLKLRVALVYTSVVLPFNCSQFNLQLGVVLVKLIAEVVLVDIFLFCLLEVIEHELIKVELYELLFVDSVQEVVL
jgi:hypothetical protein